MKLKILIPFIWLLAVWTLVSSQSSSGQTIDLSPAQWPEGEFEKYTLMNQRKDRPNKMAVGKNGMVAGMIHALAVRSGMEALKQGGSAADAVLTKALADIVLAAGSTVSLAGETVMTFYDKKTDRIYSLIATYNTVLKEDDPMSIPPQGTPSGRAVLTPGVMAGIQAAHDRFGKLPFKSIFEPAIYFAEKGVILDKSLVRYMNYRKDVITRYSEGKDIFLDDEGQLYSEGERFYQPAIAETLKKFSCLGANHFYRGEWAKKFVKIVQREGGKMTIEDMEEYQAIWAAPLCSTFRDYEIYGPGLPSYGGVNTVEAMNLLELADLAGKGYYTSKPEALYWLIQISQVADQLSPPLLGSFTPEALIKKYLPEQALDPSIRTTKEWAKTLWEKMNHKDWLNFTKEAGLAREKDEYVFDSISEGFGRKKVDKHTSGIVAVDKEGNWAVLIHSINSSIWGDTGLFVDGVSIPDSGAFQQALIKAVGPGKKVPEWDNPIIVMKDGKPYLGCTSIGAAYHETNIQCMVNVLEYKTDPYTATLLPPLRKKWPYSGSLKHPMGKGEFSKKMLERMQEMGLDLEIVESPSQASFKGAWVGVTFDLKTGRLYGGISLQGNGVALGF